MSDDDNYVDPALKGYNRGLFQVKHVVGKTLMGALIGALVVAAIAMALVALVPMAIPVFGPAITGITAALGLAAPGGAVAAFVGGALTNAAVTGAMFGAGIGAVVGGGVALNNAGEAADDEELRLQTRYRQNDQRRQMAEVSEQRLNMQRMAFGQQNAAMGANPNHTLPGMGAAGQGYSA